MINRVVLVGRMTRDPELRRTGNGTAVTSFTLALDRGFTTQDGQSADFIPCVVWNKAAESTAQYCHKGSLVGVDGSLRSRNYTNNQGQKVYVVEVMCNSVKFLESRREAEARPQGSYLTITTTLTTIRMHLVINRIIIQTNKIHSIISPTIQIVKVSMIQIQNKSI